MQVRGPGVAGGLLDENFSGLCEVVVVKEVGLITCERGVLDQMARLLIRGSAQGFNSEPTHIEDEVEDQEDEVEDGRDCEECKVESRREIKNAQPLKRMKDG